MKRINRSLEPPAVHLSNEHLKDFPNITKIMHPNYWKQMGYKIKMIRKEKWNDLPYIIHPLNPIEIDTIPNRPQHEASIGIKYSPAIHNLYLYVIKGSWFHRPDGTHENKITHGYVFRIQMPNWWFTSRAM